DDDHSDIKTCYSLHGADDIDLEEREIQQDKHCQESADGDEVNRHCFRSFFVAGLTDETRQYHLHIAHLDGVEEEPVGISFYPDIMDIQKAEAIGFFQQCIQIDQEIHR